MPTHAMKLHEWELKPGTFVDDAALGKLIDMAYRDIKSRVENG